MSIPDRIRTCNLRLRRPSVVGRDSRGEVAVSDLLNGFYMILAKGLSVTPLSTFYRKYAGLPPVLGHFSDNNVILPFPSGGEPGDAHRMKW